MLTLTAQQQADLENNLVPKAAVWYCSLYLGSSTIRFSDQPEELLYGGETYEAQHNNWRIPDEVQFGSALVPERLTLQFDGAERYVGSSLFARILAEDWHLRSMDLALAIYNQETGAFIAEPRKLYGFIDHLNNPEAEGAEPWATLTCETGTFRMLGTRNTLCTDADQRKRNSNDGFMQNTGIKGTENIPFGISSSAIPGVSSVSSTTTTTFDYNNFDISDYI